jgi:hypothetical protein
MNLQHVDSHVVTLSQAVQKSRIFEHATSVCQSLHDVGFKAYFVGGCVRDFFLFPNFEPKDIDIATDADPQVVKNTFPNSFYLGKDFGVCAVPQGGFEFEVTTFRKEGPYSDHRHPDFVVKGTWEDDSLRRDFTINALYFDPQAGILHDPFGGWHDLNAKSLACIGDPAQRFGEDSLRILRLLRFAAGLKLNIEQNTALAAQTLASAVSDLSLERILQEVTKVKAGGLPHYLELWIEFSILSHLFADLIFKDTERWRPLSQELPANFHAGFPLTALGYHLLPLLGNDKKYDKYFDSALLRWPATRSDKQLFEFFMQIVRLNESIKDTHHDVFQYSLYRVLKKAGSLPLTSVCAVLKAVSNRFEPPYGEELRALGDHLLLQETSRDLNLEQVLKICASQVPKKYTHDEISETLKQRTLPQSYLGVWLDWQEAAHMIKVPQMQGVRSLEKDEVLKIVDKIVQFKKSRGK